MKIYKGERIKTPGNLYPGGVKVTVNNKPLKHRIYHSPTGFGWGYDGKWARGFGSKYSMGLPG